MLWDPFARVCPLCPINITSGMPSLGRRLKMIEKTRNPPGKDRSRHQDSEYIPHFASDKKRPTSNSRPESAEAGPHGPNGAFGSQIQRGSGGDLCRKIVAPVPRVAQASRTNSGRAQGPRPGKPGGALQPTHAPGGAADRPSLSCNFLPCKNISFDRVPILAGKRCMDILCCTIPISF